jgi:hypothetical protein
MGAFAGFLSPARCFPVVDVFVNVVFEQQKRENGDNQIGLS